MIKVLIIEDEKPAGRRLKQLLEENSGIEVVSIVESVRRGREWFRENNNPDLIFSDIQLGDGLSFDIFSEVPIKCPIVFTTAYNEYAIKAFDVNSIAYLLKPFKKENIYNAIEKFKDLGYDTPKTIDYKSILDQIQPKKYRERILVSKADHLIPLDTKNVSYIYSEDKTVLLKSCENKIFFLNQSLEEFEKELDPNSFFRISRSMLVNRNSIQEISTFFNGTLKLSLNPSYDSEVNVSRRRVSEFKAWLNG